MKYAFGGASKLPGKEVRSDLLRVSHSLDPKNGFDEYIFVVAGYLPNLDEEPDFMDADELSAPFDGMKEFKYRDRRVAVIFSTLEADDRYREGHLEEKGTELFRIDK